MMGQIRSMTGYGRSSCVFALGRFICELQSENRRFLEINFSIPKLFSRFEMAMRKKISMLIGRGKLNVNVYWFPDPKQNPYSIVPNIALARQLKEAWQAIASELNLSSDIDLSLLATQQDLLSVKNFEDESSFWEPLAECLDRALLELMAMKKNEGEFLANDLHQRLIFLDRCIRDIEAQSSNAVDRYRIKLTDRIKELFETTMEPDERILKEVAIFAERIDITEEIVRFKSHLNEFKKLLDEPQKEAGETRGKACDFLIQELQREINTVGSKTADTSISTLVIAVKRELEKMREQTQNIE